MSYLASGFIVTGAKNEAKTSGRIVETVTPLLFGCISNEI